MNGQSLGEMKTRKAKSENNANMSSMDDLPTGRVSNARLTAKLKPMDRYKQRKKLITIAAREEQMIEHSFTEAEIYQDNSRQVLDVL